MFIFKEKFHGYIFVDAKGNEYPAVVEFAPFQRMGRVRSTKVDRKCSTYDTSEHYLEFVRTMDLEEALPKLELKSDFDAKRDNQIKSTPLLLFLNDKKSRKRDRDRNQQKQQDKKKILAPIREDVGGSAAKEHSKNAAKEKQNRQQRPPKVDGGAGAGAVKKERPERSEKEKARRAERDKMRREKRQQQIVEKKRDRESQKQPQKTSESGGGGEQPKDPRPKSSTVEKVNRPATVGPSDDQKKPPREAKKYSERRQENRSKQGTGASNNKRSGEGTAAGKPQGSAEAKGATGEGKATADPQKPVPGEEKKKESRRYSERRDRVRNKDRPAIKIYTPGSSRAKAPEE